MIRRRDAIGRLLAALALTCAVARAGNPECAARLSLLAPAELRYVVLLDAYSSATQLAEPFRRLGYRLIHVQSSAEMPRLWGGGFHPEDFERNLIWDRQLGRNFPALLRELARYRISAVIAGTEPGLVLADHLAERLGLPGNGVRQSKARRDKFLMNQHAAALVPVVKQLRTHDLGEALAWVDRLGKFPVVLKPIRSAGGNGVHVCRTREEVRRAFQQILGEPTSLLERNSSVLLQEFLSGEEYVFNTVSSGGKHVVTDVWRYHKVPVTLKDGSITYIREYNELLSPEELPPALRDYGIGVLNALSVRYGPSHQELMLTPEGPRLVELNARLMGSGAPALVARAGGHSAADLTALAYVAPDAFARMAGEAPKRLQPARTVRLISKEEGRVRALPYLEALRRLPSYAGDKIIGRGEKVSVTEDIDSSPGVIYLTHSDFAQVERDYAQIRAWEASGFFELE